MARLPSLVLPGYPYHVTQRGNRRQQTFFEDKDYILYRDQLAQADRTAATGDRIYRLILNRVGLLGRENGAAAWLTQN